MTTGLARFLKQTRDHDWMSRALDLAYADECREQWGRAKPEVHPSSAGSYCPREIQLGMLGYRGKTDPQGHRRMANGTLAHDRWTEAFRRAGILDSANVRYEITGEWSGEYDIMVKNPTTGRKHLVEIKTMNSRRYSMIPQQSPDLDEMAHKLCERESKYVYQLAQYHTKFSQVDVAIAPEAYFLLEDTNTQAFMVRQLTFDAEIRATAFRNSDIAHAATVRGKLIPPPFLPASNECKRCYKSDVCFALQRGDPKATAAVESALLTLRKVRPPVDGTLLYPA